MGRPPAHVSRKAYYTKAILEGLAERYPLVGRFKDLKQRVSNPRTLTDYLREMEEDGLVEVVHGKEYPRGAYRITRKGVDELLRIRMLIRIPENLGETQIREIIGKALRTNLTLNLNDGVTQKLVGITLLPFEEARIEMENKWRDEAFVRETCRILHSVLFFRIRAPFQTPFAKCIEGTDVFIFRPPPYLLEALERLVEKNREIPNLDAAICYALENWFHTLKQ